MNRRLFALLFCFLYFGVALAVDITGHTDITVKINGKETVLTVADIKVGADNEVLRIEGTEFHLNPTWTFFALKDGQEYNLKTWTAYASCGCDKRGCSGSPCPGIEGDSCYSNGVDPTSTLLCEAFPSVERSFCLSVYNNGVTQNYTYYNLSLINTIALTTYGGPNVPYESPGFTLKNQNTEKGYYSLNGIITGFTPRKQVELSTYRYVESEGRVMMLEDFKRLNSRPNISSVDFRTATCGSRNEPSVKFSMITQSSTGLDKINFHPFLILRTPKFESLSNLVDLRILGPHGILEWNEQRSFDILDPCNQQFLTLQKDQVGNFIVKLPKTQTLMNEDIICIAINDVSNMYDLVLYELKMGTSIWKASDRFRGMLSRDYVEDLKLRITTKLSSPVSVPQAKVGIDFNTDVDPPLIKLTTSLSLSCKIFISPDCAFDMATTDDYRYLSKPVDNCGYWYESGSYVCDGISGSFTSPAKFVKAPISAFTENTTVIESSSVHAGIIALQSNQNQSWWRRFTLMEIIMMIFLLYFIGLSIYVSCKAKKTTQVKKAKAIHIELPKIQEKVFDPFFDEETEKLSL